MGGKAFSGLGDNAFPRIPTALYNILKEKLTAQLKTLFELVTVPAEAPGKLDHGDIDFLVCGPLTGMGASPLHVKNVLGAPYANIIEGNDRTSNYALPLIDDEGCDARVERFYQVDVHICRDREEFERMKFFTAYGDLGMILGLLLRPYDLILGSKGLRLNSRGPDQIRPSRFWLSYSFDVILPFLGLSMADWSSGFATMTEVFNWVSSSRFFTPRLISCPKHQVNAMRQRAMYQKFLEYSDSVKKSTPDKETPKLDCESIRQEALIFFRKKEEYDAILQSNIRRQSLRNKFSGVRVMGWTGLNGPCVGDIMRNIQDKMGTEKLMEIGEDVLQRLVVEVQKEMGFFRAQGAVVSGISMP